MRSLYKYIYIPYVHIEMDGRMMKKHFQDLHRLWCWGRELLDFMLFLSNHTEMMKKKKDEPETVLIR